MNTTFNIEVHTEMQPRYKLVKKNETKPTLTYALMHEKIIFLFLMYSMFLLVSFLLHSFVFLLYSFILFMFYSTVQSIHFHFSYQKSTKSKRNYPNITAFHNMILFSVGAPLTPAGGSSCNLRK